MTGDQASEAQQNIRDQLQAAEAGEGGGARLSRSAARFARRYALTMGTHVGPNSQVAAGAVVRGEYPAGVLLAGAPAEVVKSLADD